MKKLIILIAVAVGTLSSCDTPVTNSTQPSTDIDGQSLSKTVVPKTSYSTKAVEPDTIRQRLWDQFQIENGRKWQYKLQRILKPLYGENV